MASFKAHAALNFWRGQELRGAAASRDAMGQFGKLASVDDLPPDAEFDRLIREAAELAKTAPTPKLSLQRKRSYCLRNYPKICTGNRLEKKQQR